MGETVMGLLRKKENGEQVRRIKVDQIRPNPDQPRTSFDEAALSTLAESISRYGILQPISVRAVEDEHYEIIAGERRFRAAELAGLSHVPCLVYAVDGERGAFLAIVENLLREDLNMFETAVAMDRLCREHGLTQEQVAERLSVSQSYVANKIRLLRFDVGMRKKIISAGLTERHARALLRLPSAMWDDAMTKITTRRFNVEQTEAFVDTLLSEQGDRRRVRRPTRGVIRDIRVFYNSVDRAVELVRRCGVAVETHREEEEEAIRLVIRIPKAQ